MSGNITIIIILYYKCINRGDSMDENFIRTRITDLRMQKGVSEYKMSIDMGHSKSYIQSISSGRALPSLSELLYICEYFEITPRDFFDEQIAEPMLVQEAISGIKKMKPKDVKLLLSIIERFTQEDEEEKK